MEISNKLSNSLYQNVSLLAKTKKKSVGETIKNAVKKVVTEDAETLERPFEIVRT